jgi:hypothetical protein
LPKPSHTSTAPKPPSTSTTSSPTCASTPSATKTPPAPGSAPTSPEIPYIVSLHGFNAYGLATWSGISGETYYNFNAGGPDSSLVSPEYIQENIQLGPLGSHYPNIAYIMEGDSPAILHTMINGLNGGPHDHPEWGGWGGRHILLDRSRQTNVYSDTTDTVLGQDNRTHTSQHATIWRWRRAFQDEMAARVQWSLLPVYASGSHPPVVVINGSCGSDPIFYTTPAGSTITLDARGTYDPDEDLPDKNTLQYNWFQYREVSDGFINTVAFLPELNLTLSEEGRVVRTRTPSREEACGLPAGLPTGSQEAEDETCMEFHVVLEVVGSGKPPIRRYRRVILQVEREDGNVVGNGGRRGERDEL